MICSSGLAIRASFDGASSKVHVDVTAILKSHWLYSRLSIVKVQMPLHAQGFFSKFLMGGLKIFRPRRSPTGTKSDGGGLAKKIWLKPKLPTWCKIRPFFCYFKHEIQLFKVLFSLKVVKFDTKMYLNFSNFWGRTSAGGGQALVQKWGQVSDGDWQNFRQMGGPPVPPGKKNPDAFLITQVLPPASDSLHVDAFFPQSKALPGLHINRVVILIGSYPALQLNLPIY